MDDINDLNGAADVAIRWPKDLKEFEGGSDLAVRQEPRSKILCSSPRSTSKSGFNISSYSNLFVLLRKHPKNVLPEW